MSRLTDPIAPNVSASPLSGVPVADDRSAANQLRDGLASKQVCPFCGSQNPAATAGSASGPCPRCTMEDSAATRQATKARIGPWHVLQTRNPAAPGMRYATLLALVGKGQVTARSVVRGPTTHQLWRYAAHVKGLSREFGVCYSCGEAIDKTAANCPHCDRAQEPAGNPDALLESREPVAANGTVAAGNGIAASVIAPNVAAAMSPTMALNEPPLHDPYSLVRQQTPAPILSHAERLRTGAGHPPEIRRRPDGRVLSAMELAAALQVAPPAPAPATHPVRTVMITLLIVGILACGIIGYARPDLRRQAQDWTGAQLARVEQGFANFHLQQEPPGDQPAPRIDGKIDGSINTATGLATGLATGTASPTVDVPAPAPSDVSPPHDDQTPPTASIKIAPGGSAELGPGNQAADSPTPSPTPNTPAQGIPTVSAPTASPPTTDTPTSVTQATPARPSLLPDKPILVGAAPSANEIWQLHSQGLNAEARQDWAEAVRCYEQIELAPRDQWPSDVKIRLENAQRELGK